MSGSSTPATAGKARRRGEPLARLRELMRKAADDAFANVDDAKLGTEVVDLAGTCLEQGDLGPDLVPWLEALRGFDRLGRHDRSVLVARGLRLCWTLPGSPAKPTRAAKKAKPEPAPEPELAALATIDTLPGVGRATADKLRARGLRTVLDLLYLLPSGYEDRRTRRSVDELDDGEVAVVEAEVGSLRQGFARGRFMASMQLKLDATTTIVARWFHRVGDLNKWTQGGRVLAIGAVRRFKGEITMAHPELRDLDDPGPAIAVRYPAVEGIAPRTLVRLVQAAVDRIDAPTTGLRDPLPAEIAAAHGLPSQREALLALHRPPEDLDPSGVEALRQASSPAHRRLAFEEFFFFQLAIVQQRGALQAQPARVRLVPGAVDREAVRACLPFEPTGAQWRVLDELEADLSEGPPMLRLLQGDVGSGKTAVAFAAALAIVRSGGQVAIMAPTELLAEQHLRTLGPWCERAGLRLALLTGTTPKGQRSSLLALLGAGQLDVVVGTHALLVEDVQFAQLGLVIVDEQHRFGVEQRALLRQKGELPHLLVMTATPIPRTMALCAYGELEVSVLDELPPGRTPPRTFVFAGQNGLDRGRRGVAKRIAAGDRAYVVCPLVEASDVLEVTDVEASAAALRRLMPERRIEVIHGRMSPKDKDAVMHRFRSGELDVLVATTVIEVGVDVPDAKTILVEHAERFGLAQLHQLRGRVGRGGGESFCLLHTSNGPASETAKRLSILAETHDGFVVAERDLALRGPGEVFGTRQSGAPRLRFAGFGGDGTRLLVAARDAAIELLRGDPQLAAHPEVAAELARRRSEAQAFAADAG